MGKKKTQDSCTQGESYIYEAIMKWKMMADAMIDSSESIWGEGLPLSAIIVPMLKVSFENIESEMKVLSKDSGLDKLGWALDDLGSTALFLITVVEFLKATSVGAHSQN